MPSYPRVRQTKSIVRQFQKVATTNHYEVFFSGFASLQKLRGYISSKAPLVSNYFIGRDLGLYCNSAELPATSFATAQIEGNRMGIVEKMAHSRVYTDSTFTFYVDSDYRVLQFFELWQDFIASGSDGQVSKHEKAYYHRMQYPSEYKVDTIRIQKFDKDHFRNVEYTFLNAFPVNVTSMPVSYEGAQVLECTVTFAYDRYYFGKLDSLSRTSSVLQQDGAAEAGASAISTPSAVGNTGIAGAQKENAAEVTGSENIQSDKSFSSETNKFVPNNPTGDFHANPSSGNIA